MINLENFKKQMKAISTAYQLKIESNYLDLLLAVLNKNLRLGLLSRMAERVTFVLIPPLFLIFLVLGVLALLGVGK